MKDNFIVMVQTTKGSVSIKKDTPVEFQKGLVILAIEFIIDSVKEQAIINDPLSQELIKKASIKSDIKRIPPQYGESDKLQRNTCDNCGHMLHYEHLECPLCGGKKFTQVKHKKRLSE